MEFWNDITSNPVSFLYEIGRQMSITTGLLCFSAQFVFFRIFKKSLSENCFGFVFAFGKICLDFEKRK